MVQALTPLGEGEDGVVDIPEGGGGVDPAVLREYDLYAQPDVPGTVTRANGALSTVELPQAQLYEPHDWALSAHWTWDAVNAALVVPADGVYAIDVELREWSSAVVEELFIYLDYWQDPPGAQSGSFSVGLPATTLAPNQRVWQHRTQSFLAGDFLSLVVGQRNAAESGADLSPAMWITRLA